MKILFVLDKPNLYGSEQHVLSLMQALQNEYEVSLLAFEEGPLLKILEEKNIAFSIIRLTWFSPVQLQKLLLFFKANKFNIIHAHQPKAIFWSALVAKLTSIPCIITIHSLPSSNIQSYTSVIKKFAVGLFHHFIKFSSELLATRVIYLSKFSHASTFFKYKSLIIPNWIDKITSDEQVKITFNSKVKLISVGSVTFNKGMDRMIKSLALIKHESWTLKILGDYHTKYKQQLIAIAEQVQISDRIEFAGYASNVRQLMSESDGFILLSRGETFGLVYIEAMSCGLPIIAWNIPVINEIIPSGNVIMSKLDDIKQVFPTIYSSQENYQILSLKNRDFVKLNFSRKNVYLKYRNLYDQVLSGNSD